MLQLLEKQREESSREYTVRVLRHNIVHNYLEPGEQIGENELAAQLSLSRTPIREAFVNLSKDGIIQIQPQRGSYVSLIDMSAVEEARFLRYHVETAVCELVCGSLTEEQILALEENIRLQQLYCRQEQPTKMYDADSAFHRMIYTFAGRERSYRAIENLLTHFDRMRALSVRLAETRTTIDDHVELLRALAQGDRARIRPLCSQHLERLWQDEKKLRSLYPQYFL